MCSDVFINTNGYHIVARTFDFLVNLAIQDKIGFIGDENTTDIIIDAEQIPTSQLATWKNKYGYFGRAAFNGEKIVDGINKHSKILRCDHNQLDALSLNDAL